MNVEQKPAKVAKLSALQSGFSSLSFLSFLLFKNVPACVCAVALLVAPCGAPGLVVSRAALRLEGEASSERSRVRMTLLLTANDVGPRFGTDLAADAIALTATDGGAFDVTVALTGCRILNEGLVYCESTDGRVRATLLRVHDSPFVYKLRVHASSLFANTGVVPLRPRLKVTLRQSNPVERIATVPNCRLRLGRNLWCQGARRPNFIFIVTDDQRWDTLQYMPNVLNVLAAQGVSFNNGFVTTSVCTPSRASRLAGR
jgi:hypothetical protein